MAGLLTLLFLKGSRHIYAHPEFPFGNIVAFFGHDVMSSNGYVGLGVNSKAGENPTNAHQWSLVGFPRIRHSGHFHIQSMLIQCPT